MKIRKFELKGKLTKERVKMLNKFFKDLNNREINIRLYSLLIELEKLEKHYTIKDARYVEGIICGINLTSDLLRDICN